MARYDKVRLSKIWQDMTRKIRQDLARYDKVRFGKIWQDLARYDKVRYQARFGKI